MQLHFPSTHRSSSTRSSVTLSRSSGESQRTSCRIVYPSPYTDIHQCTRVITSCFRGLFTGPRFHDESFLHQLEHPHLVHNIVRPVAPRIPQPTFVMLNTQSHFADSTVGITRNHIGEIPHISESVRTRRSRARCCSGLPNFSGVYPFYPPDRFLHCLSYIPYAVVGLLTRRIFIHSYIIRNSR